MMLLRCDISAGEEAPVPQMDDVDVERFVISNESICVGWKVAAVWWQSGCCRLAEEECLFGCQGQQTSCLRV